MRIQTAQTIRLLGGSLALDFVNSVDRDETGRHRQGTDVLVDSGAMIQWGRRLGVIGQRRRPLIDARELDRSLELREALYVAFAAVAERRAPPRGSLERIEASYREAVQASELRWGSGHARIGWAADDPRRVRYAVVRDAVELLGDAERLARVKLCPGHNCGWLFLNTSGRQRWCSMETCGSRAKMRRLYQRRRGAS
jgi:predicted RNA-binding Zn ribbon-like protein